MAPHSSTLALKIPWMEEPARLQSMGHKESNTTYQLNNNMVSFLKTNCVRHLESLQEPWIVLIPQKKIRKKEAVTCLRQGTHPHSVYPIMLPLVSPQCIQVKGWLAQGRADDDEGWRSGAGNVLCLQAVWPKPIPSHPKSASASPALSYLLFLKSNFFFW